MKAGLEVHQQLATRKLFCDCPSDLSESVVRTVRRRLFATSGEDRRIDVAAAFQAGRGWTFEYEVTPSNCLVELDEEPPYALNSEALDVALTMALLLGARPVDEIQVMRKIVVDGSNTSGFQRTALIAVDGHLELHGKSYSIPTLCLEEDAARKVGESADALRFRLDRLGVPLIEIATGPEIMSGTEAREVAEEIGALLRSTRKVRRGIGSIREDLNVSTAGGARIEIKGVQELRLIHRYAEFEEERQQQLLRLRDVLLGRQARVDSGASTEIGDLVRSEATGAVGESIRRAGGVRAIRLIGFHGLLGTQPGTTVRLGRELADHARAAGLKGLVHSDELPGYGISEDCVAKIRQRLGLEDLDAFLFVASDSPEKAEEVLNLIANRARQALHGIPEETRDPLPDGYTRYSRPLPGRERMYPETDVPPVPIREELLDRLRKILPERPEVLRNRLKAQYGISTDLVAQLVRSGESDRFEKLVEHGHPAAVVARLLTQELPASEVPAAGTSSEDLELSTLSALLTGLAERRFAKEAIRPILEELLRGAGTIDEAVRSLGTQSITREELEAIVEGLLDQNRSLIARRGEEAFRPLMGDVMKKVRGRRDGGEVAEVLRDHLARRTEPGRAAG